MAGINYMEICMTPNIFMSYSRRETGFVDDLTHRLEKAGFMVWLDYRVLVPGTPWAGQITKGLDKADVILLVVSKESIASPYVELEWRGALNNKNKRIVLAIFEAVKLPPELQKLEWVDFRSDYESALRELQAHLNAPVAEKYLAPQSGFRAPWVVWLTAALGLVAGLYSIPSSYTIFLPWILIPFAWRVLKRNFNFTQVQTALWLLPLGYFFYLLILIEVGEVDLEALAANPTSMASILYLMQLFQILCVSPIISFALILLLRSAGMQRWGKPEANMPKFANLYKPSEPNPRPVSFYIDHAPQDGLIATHLSNKLTTFGHNPAADIKSAESVFALISRFKTDTQADPEQQAVFPVLVQTAQPSKKLLHVQWIDFRKGIRNLDAIAQLLPQPAKMLAALGVRPAGGAQIVFPAIISAMVTFLTAFIVLDISSLFLYIMQLLYIDGGFILTQAPLPFLMYAFLIIPVSMLAYSSIKALTERRGWLASIGLFLLTQVVLYGLTYWQGSQLDVIYAAYLDFGITSQLVTALATPAVYFLFGGIFLGITAFFRWQDVRLWFPAKIKKSS